MLTRESMVTRAFSMFQSKEPRTLTDLLESLGVSRATGLRLLYELESKRLIRREHEIHGRGRPRNLFYSTKNFERTMEIAKQRHSEWDGTISLPFSIIKKACRYHSEGVCTAPVMGSLPCRVESCLLLDDQSGKV